jgi:CheY-like chemotaxis protein
LTLPTAARLSAGVPNRDARRSPWADSKAASSNAKIISSRNTRPNNFLEDIPMPGSDHFTVVDALKNASHPSTRAAIALCLRPSLP